MKRPTPFSLLTLIGSISIAIVTIAILCLYLTSPNVDSGTRGGPEEFGQFGDMLGGTLNPILSFITIILLIHSLKEQRSANELFQRAEHIAVNKSEIKDGLETYNKELNEILDEDVFQHESDGLPKISLMSIVKWGNQESFKKTRMGELRKKILYAMDCHQNSKNKELQVFVENNDDQNTRQEHALIVNKCADIRSLIATIRRGNLDLINLEETQFLLSVRKKSYTSTLVEWSNLKLISNIELKVFIDECNEITMKKLKAIVK